MVVRRITWPHEGVNSASRKPAAYEDLPTPLFVQQYLIVMKGEEEAIRAKMATHLEELMSDSELYGWDRVKAYHRVWLNQLEQGWAILEELDEKLRFRRAIIWHLATSASAGHSTSMVSSTIKQQTLGFVYNSLASPRT